MCLKRFFIFLLIITVFASYSFLLDRQKICIRLNVDKPYETMKIVIQTIFTKSLAAEGEIEYEEDDFVIIGGNTILLPAKKEGINVQLYLKECENGCMLILGYPALPLESY